jgi:hypothetical protein
MTRKLDLTLILVVTWMVVHRFVLKWFKFFLGVQ